QETVNPQPVVPQPTTVQETVNPQPVVPQPTTVQETVNPQPVVPQPTTVQETVNPQPVVVSPSMVEAKVEQPVGKPVGVISRRNNQSQSQPVLVYNPSLLLIPRHEPADVIPTQRDSSIVDWLETSGRMLPRDPSESDNYLEEEEEISELIAVDDNFSDDDVLEGNADDSGE
ncbi:DUF3134 domain-containing protein, partial [Okeania sp. SIO2F5]